MAVYGDQLAYFPEQFRTFDYFSMTTDNVAGYSNRQDLGKVRGVLQYLKRGELLRENDTLADTNVPTFWTRTKLVLNNFITIDGDTYKLTNDINWLYQGGYMCYVLESVIGNTDEQQAFDYVDLGQNSYD